MIPIHILKQKPAERSAGFLYNKKPQNSRLVKKGGNGSAKMRFIEKISSLICHPERQELKAEPAPKVTEGANVCFLQ